MVRQRTLRRISVGSTYYLSLLVRPIYSTEVPLELPCSIVASISRGSGYLEVWLQCSTGGDVIWAIKALFNMLGPVLRVGFLDGTLAELPVFLSRVERALRYSVLEGIVVLECTGGEACLSIKPSELRAAKLLWSKSRPDRLKAEVVGLKTITTFTNRLRVIRPYVIPPRLGPTA